jgi:hypothetical protein
MPSKFYVNFEVVLVLCESMWILEKILLFDVMTFAKCETEKISYKLHWDNSLFKTYVMTIMIIYLCMSYDKKESSNKKRRNRVDYLCLMSIGTLNIFQNMKMYLSTST